MISKNTDSLLFCKLTKTKKRIEELSNIIKHDDVDDRIYHVMKQSLAAEIGRFELLKKEHPDEFLIWKMGE